jgi:hypothetical protein
MTSQHDIDPNSLIMGTGARSAKFTNFGDKVSGTIMSFKARQQTDIKGTPKTYDDGNPMMQVVITLLTELVEDDEDDSLRSVYTKGQMLNAIRTAVVKAGARGLADGGRLVVRYDSDKEPSQRGFSPAKQYSARYELPDPATVQVADDDDVAGLISDDDLPF